MELLLSIFQLISRDALWSRFQLKLLRAGDRIVSCVRAYVQSSALAKGKCCKNKEKTWLGCGKAGKHHKFPNLCFEKFWKEVPYTWNEGPTNQLFWRN